MKQNQPTNISVIYDLRWIRTDGVYDGVSRYSEELARELSTEPGIDITWLVYDARQAKNLPKHKTIIANNPSNLAKEIVLPKRLNRHHPDVVYSPFFIMGSRGRKYKLVLTIHDLIYFTHRTPPHWLPRYVRLAWRLFHMSKMPMRGLLDQADIVATVSDTAKSELKSHKMTKKKIISVKNAVSDDFSLDSGAINEPSEPHYKSKDILYMGAFTYYKNVELLVMAMKYLPDIKLHLLSKITKKRRTELEDFIALHGVGERVIIHSGVSDDKYRELMSSARCLVTASKLEGFGLPIIEAQKFGVPVACSDTPIFREVAGQSALFFADNNPEECAEVIRQLSNRKASEEIIKKGTENAKRFTWSRSSKAAAKICQQLIDYAK